ncbi:MAG: outer membrane lipoprotein carrier protein LolA [Bacteroidales bacterium]|nr:outer membrane lipoprotein carrier protein LolA [Bacteroidales bacterium]
MNVIAVIAALAAMATPRETVTEFLSMASASRLSFNYTYSTENRTPGMSGSGSVTVQGSAFMMNGDGLEVICDGTSRWTVDRSAGEAIVETVAEGEDFSANPALFLSGSGEGFDLKEASSLKKGGKDVVKAVMEATVKSNVRKIVLYITPDLKLTEAEVTVSDGTLTRFVAEDFTSEPASEDLSVFAFDKATLPPDTVITDLR